MSRTYTIDIPSEDSVLVTFTQADLDAACTQVAALTVWLETQLRDQWYDLVPAFNTLCIFVRFPSVSPQTVQTQISSFLDTLHSESPVPLGHHIQLPCLYDAESGPDLTRLCDEKAITKDSLVQLHSARRYRVYAIGFTPGFPYLGPVDPRLAAPRLANPRLRVAWGSVGIADTQTGIYPSASPGGWNIIGRCPIPLFEPDSATPSLLSVGDTVQFQAINRSQYLRLLKEHDREP